MIKKIIALLFLCSICYGQSQETDIDSDLKPTQISLYKDRIIIPCDASQNWKVWVTVSSGTKSQGTDYLQSTIRNKVTNGSSFMLEYDVKLQKSQ